MCALLRSRAISLRNLGGQATASALNLEQPEGGVESLCPRKMKVFAAGEVHSERLESRLIESSQADDADDADERKIHLVLLALHPTEVEGDWREQDVDGTPLLGEAQEAVGEGAMSRR